MIDISEMEINLAQLEAELTEANVEHHALGTAGGMLHTYDDNGLIVPLPPTAAAVVAAHVPSPPPPTKNDLLLLLLADVVPGEEDTEVLTLVLQEMLRP